MADMVPLKGLGVDSVGCCEPMEKPQYSWGTRLCLNDEIVEALKAQGFQVGDVVQVTAVAVVCSKDDRMNMEEPEGVKTSLDLQITDLALSKDNVAKSSAQKLFPSMD